MRRDMALIARDSTTRTLVSAVMPGDVAQVECPDPKCASKMHRVRAVRDADGITTRTAFYRHTVKANCTIGRRDSKPMTPWHASWQGRCDNLARQEVSRERSGVRTIADVLVKDGSAAVEFQHSGIAPATISRRENVWRGGVVWVLDAASADRRGEASIRGGMFEWTSTAGLHRRRWRGIVFVDIGGGTLVELPRGIDYSAGTGELALPASMVRMWTHDEFTDQVINGDALPFPLADTMWMRQESGRRRETAEQRHRRAEVGAVDCAFSGDKGHLIKAGARDGHVDSGQSPSAGEHRCCDCGRPAAPRPGSRCQWCWDQYLQAHPPPTITPADRARLKLIRTNARDGVFRAQRTGGDAA